MQRDSLNQSESRPKPVILHVILLAKKTHNRWQTLHVLINCRRFQSFLQKANMFPALSTDYVMRDWYRFYVFQYSQKLHVFQLFVFQKCFSHLAHADTSLALMTVFPRLLIATCLPRFSLITVFPRLSLIACLPRLALATCLPRCCSRA